MGNLCGSRMESVIGTTYKRLIKHLTYKGGTRPYQTYAFEGEDRGTVNDDT
jgi:hypothetical protein